MDPVAVSICLMPRQMLRQYWPHWVHQPRFKFCAMGQIGGIGVVMAHLPRPQENVGGVR